MPTQHSCSRPFYIIKHAISIFQALGYVHRRDIFIKDRHGSIHADRTQVRKLSLGRSESEETFARREVGVSLESAGFRPADHEYWWRQHIGQIDGARSVDRPGCRRALGERLRWRSTNQHAGQFRVALPGETDRLTK